MCTLFSPDALKADLDALMRDTLGWDGRYKLIANLPYYITTPLIMHVLEDSEKVSELVIMVQKEVGRTSLRCTWQQSLWRCHRDGAVRRHRRARFRCWPPCLCAGAGGGFNDPPPDPVRKAPRSRRRAMLFCAALSRRRSASAAKTLAQFSLPPGLRQSPHQTGAGSRQHRRFPSRRNAFCSRIRCTGGCILRRRSLMNARETYQAWCARTDLTDGRTRRARCA